jgi:FkbM family methyltransferase
MAGRTTAIVIGSLVALVVITTQAFLLFQYFTTDMLCVVRNPYGIKGVLLWPRSIKGHWPTDASWDFEVKKDIFQHASQLPVGYAVVDCGAHVGDGAVPLAAAFADTGRSDITVYAIEPDTFKCNVIKALANINGVRNIRVICTGLGALNGQYTEDNIPALNSGGTTWQQVESGGVKFQTLDSLYATGQIEHPLGCLHLDVEGMELAAIQGSLSTINEYRPYLSVEDWSNDTRPFDQLLPGYTFHRRIGANNVYLPSSSVTRRHGAVVAG